MFSEEMHSRHLVELGTIKRYMDDIEIKSSVLKKSDVFPLHTLQINVEGDYQGRQRTVILNFIPLPDDELEHIQILQFYSILPFYLDDDYKDELEKLLFYINRLTGVGDFGIKDDAQVDFRYVYTASLHDLIPQAEISETLFLYVFMLDIYEELIEKVALGKLSFDEAVAELNGLSE